MSEPQNVQTMLEAAERAATTGDLASADELLKGVARIQEAELGPLHPDLAETLNNLAIVAEKAGRPGDAETFYRRAVAIASASLPADHPMVAASRQNLEDFCRARGLPIDGTVVVPAPPAEPPPLAQVRTIAEAKAPIPWVAIGAIVLALVAAAIYLTRPGMSREPSTPPPAAEVTAVEPPASTPAPAPVPAPAAPAPATPAPIEQAPPPKVVPPPAPQRSSGGVTLASVELCRMFSTTGANWRCDPAGDPAAPGRIVLYTRVKSPRDAAVIHRWYRGTTLRQSVKLPVRASATEGYRTYSRQTVDSGGDWRVEVRSASGDLLHEQRFAVR